MKDFTKTKKTTPKKILAGVTTMVALSGFVPAINAASPTANTNVGAEVLIQQAITINVGAPVDFGTIILSNTTVAGDIGLNPDNLILTFNLSNEIALAGVPAAGTMAINSSAGAVNIALGAKPTDNGGNIEYRFLRFFGTAIASNIVIWADANANVNLIGGVFEIGGSLNIIARPTPGTYNTATHTVTVTDI